MLETVFKDSFNSSHESAYPDSWRCEQNSERPKKLGAVLGDEFNIFFKGNKHIPITPPLKEFILDFDARASLFSATMGIKIFFHYNQESREGWCLRYDWGGSGKTINKFCFAEKKGSYRCELFRYRGGLHWGKHESFAADDMPGFLDDLSRKQSLRLEVGGGRLRFSHCGRMLEFSLPDVFPDGGALAFDQSHGTIALSSVRIQADSKPPEPVKLSSVETEFPCGPNGIISPITFRLEKYGRAGFGFIRIGLAGGPSKEPVHPDIDRCRFNEKTLNPYVRLENLDGSEIGKFLIVKGTVGLAAGNWNIKASVMGPADHECPLERDVALDKPLEEFNIFFGYERYMSEDSICRDGGPTEVLADKDGTVIYAGPSFRKGECNFSVSSPDDKLIIGKIPSDIPTHADALEFAKRNHFFIEGETASFKVSLHSRDMTIEMGLIKAVIAVEDVFGETISEGIEAAFVKSEPIPLLKNAHVFSTAFFTVPALKVGVYHLRARITGTALSEKSLAFEIMPKDPKALSAPLASGLPRLYPNVLSGIENEHFHPWSRAVSDTMHYNSGGNNYFKVARDLRAAELLHVYGRDWICWLKPYKTIFKERGLEPNRDLVKAADIVFADAERKDLWAVEMYRDEFVFNVLLEFTQSPEFNPPPGAELTSVALRRIADDRRFSRRQFDELLKWNWKKWLLFFTERRMALRREMSATARRINPSCAPFNFCPVYPTYASNYKSAYFTFQFGCDLRDGIENDLPGPNAFEDYPYSSGYPIARGIYNLASCKLEAPALKLYPEIFGINGETLDPRVLLANPPLGQSDPPYGFLIKQFYEYSFAAVWFDRQGFNFWKDHGYYPKTWDRDNYREMLYAYSFISKAEPVKPLRTTAFVFSRKACFEHPDYYNTDEELFRGGSVDNPAEEAVAYAYEQARADGQLAGFVVKMEDLGLLDPADVDTLVLPPLTGLGEAESSLIRELHEKGVSLLGFEAVAGLEDLFGVEAAAEVKVKNIVPSDDPAAEPLAGMSETTDHELCVCRHRLTTARSILLSGDGAPVLCLNNSKWGKTAFFTLPPTFVRKAMTLCPSYGQQSNSELIDAAARLAMRVIGDKEAETSSGVILGFRDRQGSAHLIVEEDRCPEKGEPIRPLVRIKMPGIDPAGISSDKPFELVSVSGSEALLRLSLAADESARLTVSAVTSEKHQIPSSANPS
jgi:hypothetical protein